MEKKARFIKKLFIANAVFAMTILFSSIGSMAAGADITIDKSNFPDDRFRSYIEKKIDKNHDGILSIQEIDAVKKLKLSDKKIASLEGIRFFTELKELRCTNNKLVELDVSNLTNLNVLDCSYNEGLVSLSLQNCVLLTELECRSCKLQELDMADCVNLETLYCDDNKINQMNLEEMHKLKKLSCGSSELEQLDVSFCSELEEFQCNQSSIETLDLSSCKKLKEVLCSNNCKMTTLDLNGFEELETIICRGNGFESIDIAMCVQLKVLECSRMKSLKELKVSGCENLEDLYCEGIGIEEINISGMKNLVGLECYDTKIKELDLSGCENLSYVVCGGYFNPSALASPPIMKGDAGTNAYERLEKIDFTGCKSLNWVECTYTSMASLDLSDCKKLTNFRFLDNLVEVEFNKDGFTVDGLDVSKIRRIEGAHIEGDLIVPDEDEEEMISYIYDVGVENLSSALNWAQLLPKFHLVNKHEHVYDDELHWNCGYHWVECECGARKDITAHTYETVITKATLTENGREDLLCSACGCNIYEDYGPDVCVRVIPRPDRFVLTEKNYTYDGKKKNPTLVIYDITDTIIDKIFYDVKKPNGRKKIGEYFCEVTFKGDYEGVKKVKFVIHPKGTKITKLKAISKGIKVTWKKQTANTTGYQVRYSLKQSMKSAKTVTVSKNSINSATISKLKGNKKYYVQVRTYTKTGNKKIYSDWSTPKGIETKK